ncbi:MAG: Ig-like domain-containing protein, partial [Anaerolineales bacterium]|nr:Ig-like domain-containing protein [Anaerolineales bacterium]
MKRFRFTATGIGASTLALNCLLLMSLILASCGRAPTLPFVSPPTPTAEAPETIQQAYPPALVETDPPSDTIIGHLSPIVFYFNQAMNKASVESAFSGLPGGAFTWSDEATLVFTPAEPYTPNSKLNIVLADTIQSASGFGIAEPIQLSFVVADYLRATNRLPGANSTDVNVESAIAVSFNQPVVPLGADPASLPPAFNIQPSVNGRGEWINTSTYIFYPEPAMLGGTEYTVSVSEALKTGSGVGLDRSVVNAWKFVTARPRVVSVSPSAEESIPLDAEIKLTFNQPMDRESAQSNFSFSGPEGSVSGSFAWNEEDTELTFSPGRTLARGAGYTLNVGAETRSKSGMTLGDAYGAVLRTFDNFGVSATETNYGSTTFTFTAPLAPGEYSDLVTVSPAIDNLDTNAEGATLSVFGGFLPGTDYVIELSGRIGDQWGQLLGEPFTLEVRTPSLSPYLAVKPFSVSALFVRP